MTMTTMLDTQMELVRLDDGSWSLARVFDGFYANAPTRAGTRAVMLSALCRKLLDRAAARARVLALLLSKNLVVGDVEGLNVDDVHGDFRKVLAEDIGPLAQELVEDLTQASTITHGVAELDRAGAFEEDGADIWPTTTSPQAGPNIWPARSAPSRTHAELNKYALAHEAELAAREPTTHERYAALLAGLDELRKRDRDAFEQVMADVERAAARR